MRKANTIMSSIVLSAWLDSAKAAEAVLDADKVTVTVDGSKSTSIGQFTDLNLWSDLLDKDSWNSYK
jgi:hypothetical protein